MLKNISIGTYYPGNSVLHRLQARTKLQLLVWIVVILTIANQRLWHFVPFGVIIVLVGLAIACSAISVRELWRRSWLLLLLLLLSAIPTLFAFSDSQDKTLYTFGPLHTTYGTASSILFPCLLVAAVLLLSLFLPGTRTIWKLPWLRPLRGFPLLLTLVAALLLLFVQLLPAQAPLLLGPLVLTQSGVWFQCSVFLALFVLYLLSLVLTMTTSPVALIEGLTMLLAPLRVLRLPVDDFALMTLIALRFIPTLLDEVEQLIKAQAARGADVTNGSLRERMQSLTMLFIPLMNGVLRRASELATALEARGYELEGKQTRLYESKLSLVDYVAISGVVLVTVASLLF